MGGGLVVDEMLDAGADFTSYLWILAKLFPFWHK